MRVGGSIINFPGFTASILKAFSLGLAAGTLAPNKLNTSIMSNRLTMSFLLIFYSTFLGVVIKYPEKPHRIFPEITTIYPLK
jgi:hypothetical protein